MDMALAFVVNFCCVVRVKCFCNMSAPTSEACCLKPLFVRIIMTVLSGLSFVGCWFNDNFNLYERYDYSDVECLLLPCLKGFKSPANFVQQPR